MTDNKVAAAAVEEPLPDDETEESAELKELKAERESFDDLAPNVKAAEIAFQIKARAGHLQGSSLRCSHSDVCFVESCARPEGTCEYA